MINTELQCKRCTRVLWTDMASLPTLLLKLHRFNNRSAQAVVIHKLRDRACNKITLLPLRDLRLKRRHPLPLSTRVTRHHPVQHLLTHLISKVLLSCHLSNPQISHINTKTTRLINNLGQSKLGDLMITPSSLEALKATVLVMRMKGDRGMSEGFEEGWTNTNRKADFWVKSCRRLVMSSQADWATELTSFKANILAGPILMVGLTISLEG
jgi:hypothetical protein